MINQLELKVIIYYSTLNKEIFSFDFEKKNFFVRVKTR